MFAESFKKKEGRCGPRHIEATDVLNGVIPPLNTYEIFIYVVVIIPGGRQQATALTFVKRYTSL